MPAIITRNFRTANASSFINSISGVTPENYLYLFIARSAPWTDGNDTSPPASVDCQNDLDDIWNNMLSLKRILPSDVSLGIRKKNWSYGSFYGIYRHDYGRAGVTSVDLIGLGTSPTSIEDVNYYVVTENGNVYICIDNNKNQASTINPQNYGTGSFNFIETSDGYKWRYISTVSPTDYNKFSTTEFHPVKTIKDAPSVGDPYENQYLQQVDAASKGGGIFHVVVSSSGSGLAGTPSVGTLGDQTAIHVYGDGSGLKIRANIGVTGGIDTIDVLAAGTGYTYCYITVTGITGSVLVPIITPSNGLGADPVRDLGGHFVLCDVKLSYAEGDGGAGGLVGDFTVANDYRQVGMVLNPLIYNGSSVASAATLDASWGLKLVDIRSFTPDSEITITGKTTRSRVVDWNSSNKYLRVNLPRPVSQDSWATFSIFQPGDLIAQSDVSSVAIDTAGVTTPEVKAYSGQIIYYENRRPISRDPSQVEDIHISFEF